MDKYVWKKNILNIIKEISDAEYQTDVWLKGSTGATSSYEETICALYDDLNFELFLEECEKTDPLYKELIELKNKIDAFISNFDQISIEDLLLNQSWKNIQDFAKNVIAKK